MLKYEYSGGRSDWSYRALAVAMKIEPNQSVLDLGAGDGRLAEFLPDGCGYYPVDREVRGPEYLYCDFNAGEFPELYCDVVVCAGILEYIADVRAFLLHVRLLGDRFVMTRRIKRGSVEWANALGIMDLEQIFEDIGYKIVGREIIGPPSLPEVLWTLE